MYHVGGTPFTGGLFKGHRGLSDHLAIIFYVNIYLSMHPAKVDTQKVHKINITGFRVDILNSVASILIPCATYLISLLRSEEKQHHCKLSKAL